MLSFLHVKRTQHASARRVQAVHASNRCITSEPQGDTRAAHVRDPWGWEDILRTYESMEAEIAAILASDTWKTISRTDPKLRGRTPTKSRWVYTIKYKRDGDIEKFKSRFVVCGYSQRQGIDYDRAFSSTLRATTFRCICACAAGEKLTLEHFDVTSAFTQADLDDVDLFVEPPKGFEEWECCGRQQGPCVCGKRKSKLLHLKKALYGSKQASRLWQETLRRHLVDEQGFIQSPTDPCLFTKIFPPHE